jgi:hypothetical protein
MKPIEKLVQEIQYMDPAIRYFRACDLPQAVRAYLFARWRMDARLTEAEQDLLEASFEPLADNVTETYVSGPGPDASKYHLFDDGSLWIATNAGSELWADAQVFVVERILPQMRLTRMDAALMREIGMGDQVDEVRDDFFSAFAQVLNRECGIPYSDAREHWNAWSRQAPDSMIEAAELGGRDSGMAEGRLFAETYRETVNA